MAKKMIGKRDLILLGVILLAGLVSALILYLQPAAEDGNVEITVDGVSSATLSLSEDTVYAIGDTNTLSIENGVVRMIDANCPDHICVRHRPISRDGESIICLPNKVVVTIVGGKESEVDVIA